MKSLRNCIRNGSLALAGLLTVSCVDSSYDLEKADYAVQVLDESIILPIGSLTLSMDSILKVDENDSKGIRVKNNMYYFSETTSVDLTEMIGSLTGVSLNKPSDYSTSVNLLNAPSVPYTVPAGNLPTYSGTASVTMPDFPTDPMNIKQVTLKNTTFTMKGTTVNLSGTALDNSITITCTPQDNVAEYYIDGVKSTSWTMKGNEEKTIEIKSLDFTNSKALQIAYVVNINVATAGDITVVNNRQSSMSVSIKFNGIDFETVYGKVTYSKSDSETEEFEGFGDMISGNNVLSLYNPSIKFKWRENLGMPVNMTMAISSRNATTGQTAALSNSTFTLAAAPTTTSMVVDSFTIDRNNGTSNLFKINPSELTTGYTIQVDPNTSNHFINKNTTLEMESTFELPVQFGTDLMLNITDTITNPFLSVLDKLAEQEDLGFGVTFDVTNRIPLGIKIRLTAENEAGSDMFYIETSMIKAAKVTNGLASDTSMTKTKLVFTPDQVDQFKDVARFRVGFILQSGTSDMDYVALQPTDYINIAVAAEITGGVNLDLNKKEEE